MLFEVSLDVAPLIRRIEKGGRQVENMAPTFAVIAEMLVAGVDDEFESQGRGRWQGHADSTIKRNGGQDYPLLQLTGALAASIHGEHGPDFALATTDKSYAIFHVSDGERTIIPLRNFFDVDPEIINDCTTMLLEDLARQM